MQQLDYYDTGRPSKHDPVQPQEHPWLPKEIYESDYQQAVRIGIIKSPEPVKKPRRLN